MHHPDFPSAPALQPGYSVMQFVIPKNKPSGLSIVPSDDAYVTAGGNQVLPQTLDLMLDSDPDADRDRDLIS